MSITRKRYFEHTITIDDQPIHLRLKRMTVPEFAVFEARFVQLGQGRGAPTIPDDPAAATRAQLDAQIEYLRTNAEWHNEVFKEFVSVLPGQVFDEDEQGNPVDVTNGRELVNMFPGDLGFSDVLLKLYIENRLTEDQKKKLRSRSDSDNGSRIEPKPETPGERPAPAAASANNEASASNEVATGRASGPSSGMTALSSSEPVPCAI